MARQVPCDGVQAPCTKQVWSDTVGVGMQAKQITAADNKTLKEAARAQMPSALVPMLRSEPGMVLTSIPKGCPASSQVTFYHCHHHLPLHHNSLHLPIMWFLLTAASMTGKSNTCCGYHAAVFALMLSLRAACWQHSQLCTNLKEGAMVCRRWRPSGRSARWRLPIMQRWVAWLLIVSMQAAPDSARPGS